MHKFYYFTLFCCKVVWKKKKKLESQAGSGMIEENYLRHSRLVSVGFVRITITDILRDCTLVDCCTSELAIQYYELQALQISKSGIFLVYSMSYSE